MRGGERRGIQPRAVRVPTGLGEVIDDLKNTAPPPFYVLNTSLSVCRFQNEIVKGKQRVEPDRQAQVWESWSLVRATGEDPGLGWGSGILF